MAYTKRTDIPVSPGWLAVEIDTGELVAVQCERKRVDAGVCYHAQAQSIDEAGIPRLDFNGRPIATEFKHTAPTAQVDSVGDAAITRECLLAVLGEPTTGVIAWSPLLLSAASIRISLAAAPLSGPADADSLL